MAAYRAAHQHPFNKRCHRLGLPLLYLGWIGAFVANMHTGLLLTAAGGVLQVVGHAVEGNRPLLLNNRRVVVLAVFWWFEQVGFPLHCERATGDRP